VSYLDTGGVTSATVRYGYRPDRGLMARLARSSAETTLWGRYGVAGAAVDIDARFLWDAGTAGQVASDIVRFGSWSPRVVQMTVADRRYGPGGVWDLAPGARIVFTSSQLGLSGVPAVIGAREYDARRTLVRVWLLDDSLTRGV
jgi:hypothetical protein